MSDHCVLRNNHKHGRNPYKLAAPDLSQEDLALHYKILDLRDYSLAHNDLTLKEARLFPIRSGTSSVLGVFSSNIAPPMPDPATVISLIERTLDRMRVECERLEKNLLRID